MKHSNRVSIAELIDRGVLNVGDGYRTKRAELSSSGYRIVRVADISDGLINLAGVDCVSEEFGPAIGSKAGKAGDVLLTTKGTVGRVAIVQELHERIVYSPQVCYFRVLNHEAISSRFLAFWFASPDFLRQASHRMNNTDMAAYINLGDIRSLEISLPSREVQSGIVEVLGALDDKIATNTTVARTAAGLGAAIFADATSGPDSRVLMLSDIAKNVPGKYLAKADYQPAGPFYVYGSNSVMGRHDEALVKGGFAVLAKIGSYCGNLRWSERAAWVNNNASAIVPNGAVAPAIIRHALNRIEMLPHRAGTGQPYIRMSSLFAAPVTVPSVERAESIAPPLQALSQLEAHCAEESRTLAELRDTLLPELMSGRLRVKDAEKQIEEVV